MASSTRSQQPPSSTSPKPVSILFVCLGNICRSPMAEGLFRHQTAYSTSSQHPLISKIDSCGTGAYHAGDQPDPRTLSTLAEKAKIKDYRHKARKVRVPADFEEFDYVIGMDEMNVVDLREMAKRAIKKGQLGEDAMKKIFLYGEFGGKSKDEEVQDPWYGGIDGFEIAYEQVGRFGKGLLKYVEEEAKEGIK